MTTIIENLPDKYSGSDWLESSLEYRGNRKISEFGKEVADVLGQAYLGIYHIDRAVLSNKAVWDQEWYVEFPIDRDLSTYDDNILIRLIVLCSDRLIRFEISPCNMQHLKFMFHPRKSRHGDISDRMPMIEDQIISIRKAIGMPIVEER